MDLGREVCEKALSMGAELAVVRLQERLYELVVFDNGSLRSLSVSRVTGVGVKALVGGGVGYGYTSILTREGIGSAVRDALSLARAASRYRRPVGYAAARPLKGRFAVSARVDPLGVDLGEKVSLVKELNMSSLRRDRVVSAVTRYGYELDRRIVVTSEGVEVESEVRLVGISHTSVAREGGSTEKVYDQRTFVGGYELVRSFDWAGFVEEVDRLAVSACRARTPPPGTYVAVVDNELVGLMFHEVLGHAAEGDTVASRASALYGMLGREAGSRLVTVVDDGLVDGGYPVPYDDEGVRKTRTDIIRDGALVGYLSSRSVSEELGVEPSGNARAQDVTHDVLVRQTNLYVAPGDASLEEVFDGIRYGIYLKGRGATGGEVDPATGTFTLSVGPSYVIRDGEPRELVRGVVVGGNILEVLRNVEEVGRDLLVRTSVFGGCGKDGQTVRVGDGGPHIRVRGVVVGGM